MDGSAVVASAWEYALGVEVGFVDTNGVERSGPLACWWAEPFELALPVRPFALFKEQKNFTGEYWAATSRTQPTPPLPSRPGSRPAEEDLRRSAAPACRG